MPKEWFLLQIKPNSYHKAKKNLNLQGFETFLPLSVTTSRKASRFINITQPLFPGYMFVAFNRAGTDWHKINNTYGVSRLVSFNSILRPVPTAFIEGLMQRYNLSGKLLPSIQYKKGDHVKVSIGPFANLIATIETLGSDQKIWILMDLLGRKAKIQVHSNTLHPIN
jgi:transcriptional antiterminator RfaH